MNLLMKYTSSLTSLPTLTLYLSDEMVSFQLRYCEPVIRRSVPLALGLVSVSNPKLNILDTLSKFSHDSDSEVAHNAIFAMGLVGAGTNNARYLLFPYFCVS
jgi:hypothetical protein